MKIRLLQLSSLAALASALITDLDYHGAKFPDSRLRRPNLPKPPATTQQPVTDDYHGHKVVDDYRWLEDGNSPETQQWVAEQLAYTRSVLDKLPGRDHCTSASSNCSRSAISAAPKSAANITSTPAAKARRTSRCCTFARASTATTKFWST